MADQKAVDSKPRAMSADRIGEVVIEIADDRNRSVLWPCTKRLLRGRWLRANLLGITMHRDIQTMPDIPGMRVSLNCATKTAKTTDPLNEPRQKELCERLKTVLSELFRIPSGPEKDSEKTNLSPSEVKTWLYWMRRLVDNAQALVISGALPELEDIAKLEGETSIQNWNSSQRVARTREAAAVEEMSGS